MQENIQLPPAMPTVARLRPMLWALVGSLTAIAAWVFWFLLPYLALPTTVVASVQAVCAQTKGCVDAAPIMFASDSKLMQPRMGMVLNFHGTASEREALRKAVAAVVDTSQLTVSVRGLTVLDSARKGANK